jgi:hypothetical protein
MSFSILDERDTFIRSGKFASFYEVGQPFETGESNAVCADCGAALEPRVWLPPHHAELKDPPPGDLIQGPLLELVVSRRFVDAFRGASLSGLTVSSPVELSPEPDSEYLVVRPKTLVLQLDEAASGVEWSQPPTCGTCRLGSRQSIERVVLDEERWDGSDIFVASGLYGVKVVTPAFVDCVRDHELTNFRFIPAEDYSDSPGQ